MNEVKGQMGENIKEGPAFLPGYEVSLRIRGKIEEVATRGLCLLPLFFLSRLSLCKKNYHQRHDRQGSL